MLAQHLDISANRSVGGDIFPKVRYELLFGDGAVGMGEEIVEQLCLFGREVDRLFIFDE